MKIIISILFIFLSFNIFCQDDNLTVVAVGEATAEKDKMIVQDAYIQGSLTSAQKVAAYELVKLVKNDFSFYQKKFFLVEAAANNTNSRPVTNYDYWSSKGIRYLGTVQVEKSSEGIRINFILED